jgi:hypothetical protein
MSLNPPSPASDRGFLLYGGSAVRTSYGHSVEIRVQESSAASGPHVWLFIDEAEGIEGGSSHLSLADAIEIRDRLTQFIDDTPDRWTRGAAMLREAQKEVARRRAAERKEETC